MLLCGLSPVLLITCFAVSVKLDMDVIPKRMYFLGADTLKYQVSTVVLMNSVAAIGSV